MACLWGLVGLEFAGKPVNCYVNGARENGQRDKFNDWKGDSWVRQTFVPGGTALHNDDPCDEFAVFLIAWHWSVMTITSIGYGDIVPTCAQE